MKIGIDGIPQSRSDKGEGSLRNEFVLFQCRYRRSYPDP